MEPTTVRVADILTEEQKKEIANNPTGLIDVRNLKLQYKVPDDKLHITTITRDQIEFKLIEYEDILKKFNGNVIYQSSFEVARDEQGEATGFDFFLTPHSRTPPMTEEEKEIHRIAELKRKMYRAKKKADKRNR